MKLGVLFSGGKDSTYAAFLAKNEGYDLACLISVFSSNEDSFMFHTPSVEKTKKQAEVMGVPLVVGNTQGEKEKEIEDLRKVIMDAKEKYGIEGVVTGAVNSVYQATRVQKVCDDLGLEVFNSLWQKNQLELLKDLVEDKFEVIIVGVAAYPLDEKFLGRKIDGDFILEMESLQKEFDINPAGEGGEFESFVLNCPLFEKGLEVKGFKDFGEKNSWRRELEI
jgi:diphthine-ammonia ligase